MPEVMSLMLHWMIAAPDDTKESFLVSCCRALILLGSGSILDENETSSSSLCW